MPLMAALWLGACTPAPRPAANGRLYAFVSSSQSETLSVIDVAELRVVATVGVGGGPTSVRAHPSWPEVYVVLPEAGEVVVMEPANASVVARISVGAQPHFIDFSPDGREAYVANAGASQSYRGICRRERGRGRHRFIDRHQATSASRHGRSGGAP
jgi:YVTN family beta-propeller protein